MHSVTRIIRRAITGTIGAALLFGPALLIEPALAADTAADVCDQVDTLSKLEICRTEVQKHPMNVELQQKLGDAMVYLGDYDGAAEAYREITKVRQDDAAAHLQLAGTLAFVQRYDEAVEPVEAALRLDPANIPAFQAAAIIYHQARRNEDMVRVTIRAAELGDAISMYDLIAYYRDGYGVAPSSDRALMWAQRAADAGHLKALSYMVRVHLEGLLDQPVDEPKAAAWAQRERTVRRTE